MMLQQAALAVVVSCSVSALSLGSYDKWIRQPRTPRLAVVDVGSLFAQAQQANSVAAIKSPGAKAMEASTVDFGTRLQSALRATAQECTCTLVAMPAVFGSTAGVPDLTANVREQLVAVGNSKPSPTHR